MMFAMDKTATELNAGDVIEAGPDMSVTVTARRDREDGTIHVTTTELRYALAIPARARVAVLADAWS